MKTGVTWAHLSLVAQVETYPFRAVRVLERHLPGGALTGASLLWCPETVTVCGWDADAPGTVEMSIPLVL